MSQEPNMLNRALTVLGAIANLITLSSLSALHFRQDALLISIVILLFIVMIISLSKLFRNGRIDRANSIILGIICFTFIAITAIVWIFLVAKVELTPIQIEIVEPQNETTIRGYRHLVKGTVSDPRARLYVMIRPHETPQDIWVQDPVTIDRDGNWQVNCYFGEARAGAGEKFEISAIATSENLLIALATGNLKSVGKTHAVPRNTNRSNFVTVTRSP